MSSDTKENLAPQSTPAPAQQSPALRNLTAHLAGLVLLLAFVVLIGIAAYYGPGMFESPGDTLTPEQRKNLFLLVGLIFVAELAFASACGYLLAAASPENVLVNNVLRSNPVIVLMLLGSSVGLFLCGGLFGMLIDSMHPDWLPSLGTFQRIQTRFFEASSVVLGLVLAFMTVNGIKVHAVSSSN